MVNFQFYFRFSSEEREKLLKKEIKYGPTRLKTYSGGGMLYITSNVGSRRYKEVDELNRCVNTNSTFNEVTILCDNLICILSLDNNGENVFTIYEIQEGISLINLLTLSCNVTPEDLDKIIEKIKDRCEDANKALEQVKQLLTMINVFMAEPNK